MIFLTASGASSGGSATPLPRAIALSTAFEPPDAGVFPRSAEEAARVGFASVPVRPGSAAAASSGCAVTVPATGSTSFAREASGSGGRSAEASCVAAGATSADVAAFVGRRLGGAERHPGRAERGQSGRRGG